MGPWAGTSCKDGDAGAAGPGVSDGERGADSGTEPCPLALQHSRTRVTSHTAAAVRFPERLLMVSEMAHDLRDVTGIMMLQRFHIPRWFRWEKGNAAILGAEARERRILASLRGRKPAKREVRG